MNRFESSKGGMAPARIAVGSRQLGAEEIAARLPKGLKFRLEGEKLHGSWVLVRTRSSG
jgi:hypothetical protein